MIDKLKSPDDTHQYVSSGFQLHGAGGCPRRSISGVDMAKYDHSWVKLVGSPTLSYNNFQRLATRSDMTCAPPGRGIHEALPGLRTWRHAAFGISTDGSKLQKPSKEKEIIKQAIT